MKISKIKNILIGGDKIINHTEFYLFIKKKF